MISAFHSHYIVSIVIVRSLLGILDGAMDDGTGPEWGHEAGT